MPTSTSLPATLPLSKTNSFFKLKKSRITEKNKFKPTTTHSLTSFFLLFFIFLLQFNHFLSATLLVFEKTKLSPRESKASKHPKKEKEKKIKKMFFTFVSMWKSWHILFHFLNLSSFFTPHFTIFLLTNS